MSIDKNESLALLFKILTKIWLLSRQANTDEPDVAALEDRLAGRWSLMHYILGRRLHFCWVFWHDFRTRKNLQIRIQRHEPPNSISIHVFVVGTKVTVRIDNVQYY